MARRARHPVRSLASAQPRPRARRPGFSLVATSRWLTERIERGATVIAESNPTTLLPPRASPLCVLASRARDAAALASLWTGPVPPHNLVVRGPIKPPQLPRHTLLQELRDDRLHDARNHLAATCQSLSSPSQATSTRAAPWHREPCRDLSAGLISRKRTEDLLPSS
jgi:hypothetical protein